MADPPVVQPQGIGRVQLEIDNPQQLEMQIFRIVGNEIHSVDRPLETRG